MPDREDYDDVGADTFDLAVPGGTTAAWRYRPVGDGPHPAVVLGAEGTGVNSLIRHVGATLAHLGYVSIVADYYRGAGPADPEDYSDVDDMVRHIDALDFRRAVQDTLAAVDHVQALPYVDPTRVASWGYCTGGTLAMFAACLRHDLAASVWFYPSQPTFATLDAAHPVHALDLLWNVRCPTLLVLGTLDVVLPAERLAEVRRLADQWEVDLRVRTYEGAGHAFNAVGSSFHDPAASDRSWLDATEFLAEQLGGRPA